ncbi:MAG: hypothetical protein ABI557_19780 [Aureliella sp.]
MLEATSPNTQLVPLVGLFYPRPAELGSFSHCTSQECPPAYRAMLDHEAHMTVTVENRHNDSVDVDVLATAQNETHYMRKILLRRQADRRVVLFGIVRLALNALHPQVRDEILSQGIPLGRVLITHDVLRQVQLNALWRVACGAELAELFEVPAGSVTYGRTALIYCDGKPAVELLEIVSPEESLK